MIVTITIKEGNHDNLTYTSKERKNKRSFINRTNNSRGKSADRKKG